jgi:hypothetical protein
MADKKSDFVVTDRRKFTSEGERREDTPPEPQEKATEAAGPAAAPPPNATSAPRGGIPQAPSSAEQQKQHDAYKRSGTEIDDRLRADLGGRRPEEFHMTFERLIASLYMTAMMQLGLMHPEGEQPRADLLGARQTIDTLSILDEKTKGNLTDTEKNLLQNCLYELRMAFVELTSAITRPPDPADAPPGGAK